MTQNLDRATASAVGAPGAEIEITPEMIEAGVEALGSFHPDWDSKAEAIQRILEACLPSRRKTVAVAPLQELPG